MVERTSIRGGVLIKSTESFGNVLLSESAGQVGRGSGGGSSSSGSSLKLREASFRNSDADRTSMSSNLKKQRSVLASNEATMTDKIKTVTTVLKAIGKAAKSEKLANLMEKRAQPNEIKAILQKFESAQYVTLMEYLFWFSTKHVVTTRESGTCLLDNPCLQSTTQNRREKVDACINQIQTVVGVCFAKVTSVNMTDTFATMGLSTPMTEIEKIGDHLQILADLYLFLLDEAPQTIRRDFIETMTFFAREALEYIGKLVGTSSRLHTLTPQTATGANSVKLRLIERVIVSCLTVAASFQESVLIGRVQQLDGEVIQWGSNLVRAILNLCKPLQAILKCELSSMEARHLLFDRVFPSKVLKNLIGECEIEMRNDSQTSLFSIATLVAYKCTDCIYKFPERLPFRSDHTSFILKFAEATIFTQIRIYLAAEVIGIDTRSQKVMPQNQLQEEVKYEDISQGFTSGATSSAGREDEKVDVDDFVREEIEGPGLISSRVYATQVTSNSIEFVEHKSFKLLTNQKIEQDQDLEQSKLPILLSRSTQAQDDWLRTNFAIFRLAERIIAHECTTSRGTARSPIKGGFLSHLFDLYKMQLYFLLLVHRLVKYIEDDTDTTFFLSDLPSKAEKQEFNCQLSKTLARMFNIPKVCREMTLYVKVQQEIFQILSKICDQQFNPVDQSHYLKVFFLLFLNRLDILPIEKQVPSQEFEEIQTVQRMRRNLCTYLFMLFRIDWFSEKFLPITEDIFDIDSILVIRSLIQIWHQEEYRRRQANNQVTSQVVSKVNMIIVQRQAYLNLARLAAADGDINKLCIEEIFLDVKDFFKVHGKPDGDLYADQEVTIEMPHQLPPVTATEYKLPKDQFMSASEQKISQQNSSTSTTEYNNIYSSRLYMLFKLAIAVISSDATHLDADKSFHILYQSTDAESHYTSQHSSTNNRTMIPMEKNQSFPGTVREPVGRDSRGYVSAQGSLSRRNCDDCLKCQFNQFAPNKSLNPINLLKLLASLLTQIEMFTKQLTKQALIERRALDQNVITANLQNNLLDKLNMTYNEHYKQLYMKNQICITKSIDESRRRAPSDKGYKIMEKVNQMVQRFVIFVFQCRPVANMFCKIMNRGLETDHRDGLRRFESIQDEVFQLLVLRNLIFNTDVFSNHADAIWPIKTLINKTVKSIKTQWTHFQNTEQATNKFTKEMQQLSTLTNEVNPTTRIQKMRSQMAMGNRSKAHQLGSNSRQNQRSGNVASIMTTKDIIAKHQEVSEKNRAMFKKQAEIAVSIISIYLANITKQKKNSLLLFERNFIFELLQVLKSVVIQEGSYSLDLNDQLLNAFLFEKVEPTDPLKLEYLHIGDIPILSLRDGAPPSSFSHSTSSNLNNDRDRLFKTSNELFSKMLAFLIQSLTEQISTAKAADLTHPGQGTNMMIQIKQTLNTIIGRLHMKIVEPENTSVTLLKFARSLNRDCINLFKKVYIFLRESVSEDENDGLGMRRTILKLNEIFGVTFSRVPKAIVFRDFFSFLREIFFYQQQMDLTDLALAQDMMSIMIDSIRLSSRYALSQNYYSNQNSLLLLQDSFYFSRMSPGALVLNDVPISVKDELFVSLMFKIHADQIQEDLDQLNLENQNQVPGVTSNQCIIQRMVLCSFQLIMRDQRLEGVRTIDVELKVNTHQRVYSLALRLRAGDKIVSSEMPREMPLDTKWNFLMLHFTKKHTVEVILKGGSESYLVHEMQLKDYLPEKNGRYMMALGNQVMNVTANAQEYRDEFTTNQAPKKVKQLYFRGQTSLPFFFKGVTDFKKILQQHKQQANVPDRPSSSRPMSAAESSSMCKYAQNFQCMSISAEENLRAMNLKTENMDYMSAFIEVLIDHILNRKMIGLTELSLINKIMRQQDKRTMALETVKMGFNAQGLKQDSSNKKYTINDFITADLLNSQAIHVHSLLSQMGSISAVKAYRAVEVFESLGGFKNMYPLVQNVVKSNLKDDFGAARPGALIGQIFKILEALLLERPEHIQMMVNQRNLFGLLKHCLNLIGKNGFLSSNVLSRLTSIVTNNILAQCQYRKAKTRIVETEQESQPADGKPPKTALEEETIYELTRRSEYNLKHVKDMKGFYTQFLSSFTHTVLLDKQFLLRTYSKSRDLPSDDSSSIEQVFGGRSSKLVLTRIVDMMHSICCPMSLKRSILTRKKISAPEQNANQFEGDGGDSSNSFMMDGMNENKKSQISAAEDPSIDGIFTNYVELRNFIITEKTIIQLRELLETKSILDEQYASTLSKISQCIASALVFTGSEKQMREIVQLIYNAGIDIPIVKMKANLEIILCVLSNNDKDSDKTKTLKICKAISELKSDQFVRSTFRYVNDGNYNFGIVEQITKLADQIVQAAIDKKLLKQGFRDTYESQKREQTQQVNHSDSSGSNLGRVFDDISSSSGLSRYGVAAQQQSARNHNRQTANMTVYEETKDNKLLKSLRQPAYGVMLAGAEGFEDGTSLIQQRDRKFSNGPGIMKRPTDLAFVNNQPPESIRVDSLASNAGEEDNDVIQVSMAGIYAKSQFKKTVKRLQEDSSSMWYDHQEQEMLEYEELCENYEKLKQTPDTLTPEMLQKDLFEAILKTKDPEARKLLEQRMAERKSHFNDIVENPALLVPNYPSTIPHQRLGFVTQRRVVDRWGRMMLLKPNRKYFKEESKMLYEYHIYDYLDKMFALSLLKDEDYDDLVVPTNQYKDLFEQKMNSKGRRGRSASPKMSAMTANLQQLPQEKQETSSARSDIGRVPELPAGARAEVASDDQYFNVNQEETKERVQQ